MRFLPGNSTFSTHAAIYADVGFRATAEVLEENKQPRLLNDAFVGQARRSGSRQ